MKEDLTDKGLLNHYVRPAHLRKVKYNEFTRSSPAVGAEEAVRMAC